MEQLTDHNCIYRVVFEVKVILEEGKEDWVQDELAVLCGPDANEATVKARMHAESDNYDHSVLDFRLREVKLLAMAEI